MTPDNDWLSMWREALTQDETVGVLLITGAYHEPWTGSDGQVQQVIAYNRAMVQCRYADATAIRQEGMR